MLFQKKTGKLQSRWRESFVIDGFESERELSYRIRQLGDRRIKHTYHGNYLKLFVRR